MALAQWTGETKWMLMDMNRNKIRMREKKVRQRTNG